MCMMANRKSQKLSPLLKRAENYEAYPSHLITLNIFHIFMPYHNVSTSGLHKEHIKTCHLYKLLQDINRIQNNLLLQQYTGYR